MFNSVEENYFNNKINCANFFHFLMTGIFACAIIGTVK